MSMPHPVPNLSVEINLQRFKYANIGFYGVAFVQRNPRTAQ